jgi:hypothetical protein
LLCPISLSKTFSQCGQRYGLIGAGLQHALSYTYLHTTPPKSKTSVSISCIGACLSPRTCFPTQFLRRGVVIVHGGVRHGCALSEICSGFVVIPMVCVAERMTYKRQLWPSSPKRYYLIRKLFNPEVNRMYICTLAVSSELRRSIQVECVTFLSLFTTHFR